MGHSIVPITLVCGVFLVIQIFNPGLATVTFDSDSTNAFQDVYQGNKHFALFKPSNDLSSVSLVKTSDGEFQDLASDLLASKEVVLGAYSASVKDDEGQNVKELVVLVWVPSGVTEELGQKYSVLIDELEEDLDLDIWLAVITDSDKDLNLESLLESASQGFNRIISNTVEYQVQDTTKTFNVNTNLKSALKDLSSGLKRYVILKFSDDFSQLLLEKAADSGASFADLASDLGQYEVSGQVRFVVYYVPVTEDGLTENRLLLIVWTPSTADKTLVKKYLSKVQNLKGSLDVRLWTDVTVTSSNELTINGINQLLPAFIGRLKKPDVQVLPERLEEEKPVDTPDSEEDVLTDDDGDDDDDDEDDYDDDDDEQVNLDANVESAVGEVSKGLKRYVLLKWTTDNKLVVDKTGGSGAKLVDLVNDLTSVQKTGEGRYVLYNDDTKNKLVLIVWIPSTITKQQALLYKRKFKVLKRLLKLNFWVVVSRSVTDLNLDYFHRSGNLFDFNVWFKRFGQRRKGGHGHHFGGRGKGHLKDFLRGKHVFGGNKGGHGWGKRFGFGGKHRGGMRGGEHGGKHHGGWGGFKGKGDFGGKMHGEWDGFKGKGDFGGKMHGGWGKFKGQGDVGGKMHGGWGFKGQGDVGGRGEFKGHGDVGGKSHEKWGGFKGQEDFEGRKHGGKGGFEGKQKGGFLGGGQMHDGFKGHGGGGGFEGKQKGGFVGGGEKHDGFKGHDGGGFHFGGKGGGRHHG